MQERSPETNLQHFTAFVLHQSFLLIGRLTGPVGFEAGGCLPDSQQALSLLIHKAAADAFHVGQVDPHQLPAILRVQTSEGQAGSVPAADRARTVRRRVPGTQQHEVQRPPNPLLRPSGPIHLPNPLAQPSGPSPCPILWPKPLAQPSDPTLLPNPLAQPSGPTLLSQLPVALLCCLVLISQIRPACTTVYAALLSENEGQSTPCAAPLSC